VPIGASREEKCTVNRNELERPFDPSLIKSRQGGNGKTFSFVPGSEYIRRLNDAFDGSHWSFTVVDFRIESAEVIVLGKLVAGDTEKMAFGGSSITVSRSTGETVSIADDLKSASTDALKRAARLLGVGLHLYSDDKPNTQPRNQPRHQPQPRRGQLPVDNDRQQLNGNRVTQRQLTAIYSMGRNLGMTSDQIRSRTVEAYQAQPEQLTRSEASSIISELQADLDGRPIN
jgi:hypothetical protein